MARSGRRPGNSDSARKILEAARGAFAEHGYDRATIRMIAERAGVDPALVHHYYGKKPELFATAMRFPVSVEGIVETLLDGPWEDAGRRVALIFFSGWEQPESREVLLGVLRSAFVGGPAVDPFREFITSAVLGRVAPLIDLPDAELRIELTVGHLIGIAVLRYVLRIEPIASASIEDLVARVAPRLQEYLTGT